MTLTWRSNLEKDVLSAFEQALQSLPHLALVNVRESVPLQTDGVRYEADAIIQIEMNGKPATLLVETKSNVFPRDARETIWQLRRQQKALHDSEGLDDSLPVIASRSLSEGAKTFLRSENVGYFEEGGSLYLANPDFYVFLDKPPSKTTTQSQRSLFSGRRAQVLLALLQEPESWRGVNELAEKVFVSPATVSQVLVDLERREWVSTRGSGPRKERKLHQPTALLDAWAKQVMEAPKPRLRRFFVPSLKTEDLALRVHKICEAHNIAYAMTGEWAGQIYSPFLSSISQVRLRFPPDQPLASLVSELNAREVTEGSNLALLETPSYGDFLFREQERGVWLANPIIVYLDLLQSDGRAKEMAEHLRRERIHF
ncbi:MAG TPA: type IV toxin-antitoxin system AbiEi family antitoxin [Edaphobacter sp.]|nr:type IV toxin-antitoxin system AbiEi family antitoxin [Edaphobacter sp.]